MISGKPDPHSFGSIRVKTPMLQPGLRVGVMGGSFNPPHAGHALISRTALRRLGLDQLWWVVTPGNPLKTTNGLPPTAERIAWCERLAADNRMHVTSFEEELGTPYTAATISYLVRRHRDVNFVWIMGADNLASFHRWQRWRDIVRCVPIAVVDRPGWRHRALASQAAQWMQRSYVPEQNAGALSMMEAPAWTFLTGPLSRLSSTELRRAARAIAQQKNAMASNACTAPKPRRD